MILRFEVALNIEKHSLTISLHEKRKNTCSTISLFEVFVGKVDMPRAAKLPINKSAEKINKKSTNAKIQNK